MNRTYAAAVVCTLITLVTACSASASPIASLESDEWEVRVLSVERAPIIVGEGEELETPILLDVAVDLINRGVVPSMVAASDFVIIDSQGETYTDPVLGGEAGGLGGAEGVAVQGVIQEGDIPEAILWSPMIYGLPLEPFEIQPNKNVEQTYRFVVPGDSSSFELEFKSLPPVEFTSPE